jgi:hypothetical protein
MRQITQGPSGATRRAEVFNAIFAWYKWFHNKLTSNGIVATVHP